MKDLANCIFELGRNAIEAKASKIQLTLEVNHDIVTLSMIDDGVAYPTQELERMKDPFYSIKQHGGFGLALVCHRIERIGGIVILEGKKLSLQYSLNSIDTLWFGEISQVILLLALECIITFQFVINGQTYLLPICEETLQQKKVRWLKENLEKFEILMEDFK